MPRKIRDLTKDLRDAGFILLRKRGKGDHRMYGHLTVAGVTVVLDGEPGDDAKDFQEKQVREAVAKVRAGA
jgi:predicted RNA binding protein YcfA (HicA-like mRNA interferase family)